MTVSASTSRSDYAGNGSTTAFATGFRFLQNSDLRVILTIDATGVETAQVETTNYTVTGAGPDAGGTVTMLVAPASGETLTIKRDVPLTQGTDYVENDAFPAEAHEEALDKLTMIVQQQQEILDRTLKLSEAQQSSGLTIPVPVTDRFMQWDSDGNLKNVDISLQGALVVSAFAKTYLDELNAADTRTVLETKESFTDLDETPSSYTSQADKRLKVNGAENAVEFVSDTFTELEDTPASLSGEGGKTVLVNSGGTALEFIDQTSLVARAWVNFNGIGTVAIRDSENVTSITDNGVGDYTVNITNALPNTDFVVVATGSDGNVTVAEVVASRTTTAVRVKATNASTAALLDISSFNVLILAAD